MIRRSCALLSSSWRDHGISYLKYLNVCTETLHSTVKESRRAKYERWSKPCYTAQRPDGAGGQETIDKVPIHTKDY
ncbi:Mitochondrial ATP synthase epsilon chain, putative [Trypanosoma equiperdum]|uniref:ATP synthase subunit epsilon, mitochondrial n=7 Tax=Trypanozoon TaxID=39700 RepID=ATP5E_TRYBB|nr:hypothetical protein, conserved [Trypanosoma brucei gambiense DAL972]XP_822752.1 hypothetical protein, conserved [Trypanosoma brucei brucei TREU927]P0DPG3.1 RecName: Full=ATP synthase subunit epsilon, mitochondrial; AltName: Full=ATP synthase F1 subunit epsilon; Flags: Precursor [Trypanosoma brucei brucei]8AP6_I1 Chain I1, ATP synthase subunit epsilon, mitochondrial [Trypanosoma brucei brucei]8AP6_I2 Chain I2, ATP synthase subunit epsilon, mitochondrial [Trypanosoma brucei brucei]8AP9_I Cha|eukprot:XP_011777790.1 hypothetical protein, conserved [Trypanosoma brucei gambiense DAL972]